MVEFLTPYISTECERSVSSSPIIIGCFSFSKFSCRQHGYLKVFTMTHFTPSRDFFPAFGIGAVGATGVLGPLGCPWSAAGLAGGFGLSFFSFKAGFLCVICDLSTCFKEL